MTREEAIKIFNTLLFFGKCAAPQEELEECLKMAIKALSIDIRCKNCNWYGEEEGNNKKNENI